MKHVKCELCLGTGEGLPGQERNGGCGYCRACGGSGRLDEGLPTPELRFDYKASERANAEWGATCGPHSIAAACGKTLDEVREHLPKPFKGWMNPTHIRRTLYGLRVVYRFHSGLKASELCQGISRVQFEGKWLHKGVPAIAAYAHTHYVARMGNAVLCTMACHHTWIPLHVFYLWHRDNNPLSFHITHHYQLLP